MTTSPSVHESALAERLRVIAPYLLPGTLTGDPTSDPVREPRLGGSEDGRPGDAGSLLEALVGVVATTGDAASLWALLTSVCGAYPTRDDMDRVRRRVELAAPQLRTLAFLEAAHPLAVVGDLSAQVTVVTGSVLADVDFTAKNDLNSGIQRVVRSLLPFWSAERGVVPVAWAHGGAALRTLADVETDRVLRWGSAPRRADPVPAVGRTLLLPWRTVVVMIETPGGEIAERLACIGERSGNALVCVVHDAIPVVSSDLVLPQVATTFVRYLTAVKFSSRVAAVSRSAGEEFAGFVQSLPVQGLTGPKVVAVPLGGESIPELDPGEVREPKILVVGSHEPRKNHLTVLHSAEVLWREGLEFAVEFIGAGGWGDDFPRRVNELRLAGRTVTVRQAVSEEELEQAYRTAAFSVFPSLHEGYGLPVVESFSRGTPVVTSDFGSMRDIAAGGGAVTVDPRDAAQLTDVMRELLTQPARLAQLREEIVRRPARDWKIYADELWEALVRPELDRLEAPGRPGHRFVAQTAS